MPFGLLKYGLSKTYPAERHFPLAAALRPTYDLVIVGKVRRGKLSSILSDVSTCTGTAAVYVADEERDIPLLRADYPHLLVVPQQDGWAGTLILVSIEALKRVEAVGRAQRAERMALACERHATLGRYMLEMRPGVNNALTSVLGNADLLLVEPRQFSSESREQIRTIHAMALRLNEIMQRFSSLVNEIQASETMSRAETTAVSPRLMAKP